MDNSIVKVTDMSQAQLDALRVRTVDRYYNGARGCMCGCKGTYYDNTADNARRIKGAVGRLLADAGAALQDGYILFRDTGTRTSAVYFK